MAEENPAAQRQTAVITLHLRIKQLPLFDIALRSVCKYSMAEENPEEKSQTAVTAYL